MKKIPILESVQVRHSQEKSYVKHAQKKSQVKRSLTKAFTIIELLVVIAIIALLTGIVMTNLTGAKGKGRDAKRVSDLGQIQMALELYYDRCKEYPTNTSDGDDEVIDLNASNCNQSGTGITLGTFLPKAPTPPNPAKKYQYNPLKISPGGKNVLYVLRTELESNNVALQDDIDNKPGSWPDKNTLIPSVDLDLICNDTAAGPFPANQYCLISN